MAKIPELLCPAGSPEKLRYALAFGADAVYAGIPRFSLRAKENPYNNSSLKEDIEYCHQVGKKIYVTANILPQNRKLQSFKRSIATIAEARPDGIIMSDPGMNFQNYQFIYRYKQIQSIGCPWHFGGIME